MKKTKCTLVITLDGPGIKDLSPGKIAKEITDLIGNSGRSSRTDSGWYEIRIVKATNVEK